MKRAGCWDEGARTTSCQNRSAALFAHDNALANSNKSESQIFKEKRRGIHAWTMWENKVNSLDRAKSCGIRPST
jgi:hypothetical protein